MKPDEYKELRQQLQEVEVEALGGTTVHKAQGMTLVDIVVNSDGGLRMKKETVALVAFSQET